MPATASTISDALKEVWTADHLEEQIYKGDPLLDRLEKTGKYTVGEAAITPIKTHRSGGYTPAPAAGSTSLNTAGNVGSDQASWDYKFHYQQVEIQVAAMVKTEGKEQSVAEVVDMEMEGASESLRKQLTRQAFSAGNALIAECTTTSSSTTVNLLTTGYGPDALVRRWLHKTQVVDIGTAADEDSEAAGRSITAVSTANNTITINGAAVDTAASDFVSIANGRSGTTSYEMDGLQNIISETATVGTLAPGTEPEWKAADVDTSTTDMTLDALYLVQRKVNQETGQMKTNCITSYKQREKLYKLLQMQVRFDGNSGITADPQAPIEYGGMKVEVHVDCPDRHFWFVDFDDLFMVRLAKPFWTSDITGGKKLEWKQGTTAFVGMLAYPINLACRRRNSMGGLTALTAT